MNLTFNELSALDLTANTLLENLFCHSNNLNVLDVSNCPQLSILDCYSNELTSLNITGTSLNWIDASWNQLTVLDLSGLDNLQNIYIGHNLFSYIDATEATNLLDLAVNDCTNLTSLFMKNGSSQNVWLNGSDNLSYICIDDSEFNQVLNSLPVNGVPCEVNTYCSFAPGGNYSMLNGTFNFDSNSDGCDVSENVFWHLNLAVTNGTVTTNSISSNTGSYNMVFQSGNYTITPVLENPTYFSITPATITVDFPAMPSPVTQNFCITPNGTIY
ncbi:MAG TPA: hypothetical protein VGB43_07260, partial [Flavobacterium sp.]